MPREKLSIVIADDHPLLRQGLLRLLQGNPLLVVVGEAGDGEEAMRLIVEKKPDIAVLDISMPGKSGLEIVRQANERDLPVEFIILTMFKEEEYFNEALDIGVKGYLLKESALSDLTSCIQAVADGRFYVSPLVSSYLVQRKKRTDALYEGRPALSELTPTERRILKLLAENKTSKDIAEALFISYRTVQNHRTNMCNKLGLQGYNKLLHFAIENKSSL